MVSGRVLYDDSVAMQRDIGVVQLKLDMLDVLVTLPLPVATLIVAGISVALTAGVLKLTRGQASWLVAFLAPFVVSYALYFVPVWVRGGINSGAFLAWAGLYIGVWAIVSLVACLVFVFLRIRNRE
jgi:hypothetical protein